MEAASELKVGQGLDETVQMDPVITKKHQERALGCVDKDKQEGAMVALDRRGQPRAAPFHPSGVKMRFSPALARISVYLRGHSTAVECGS